MPTILSHTRQSSVFPKCWIPFYVGKQRILFIGHFTRLALGIVADIKESGGSINLHLGWFIFKFSLFTDKENLKKKLKKILKVEYSRPAPNLDEPFRIFSILWDPTHFGLALVIDPLDTSYNINLHLGPLAASVQIPVVPPFAGVSRKADIAYLEKTLAELGGRK